MKLSSSKLVGSEKLSLGGVGHETKDCGEEGELRAKANDGVLGLKHNFLMFGNQKEKSKLEVNFGCLHRNAKAVVSENSLCWSIRGKNR